MNRQETAIGNGLRWLGGLGGPGRAVPIVTEIFRCPMSALGVRRDKAALSSGCKSHPATAPAGSNRSSQGGNELAEAFGMRVTNW